MQMSRPLPFLMQQRLASSSMDHYTQFYRSHSLPINYNDFTEICLPADVIFTGSARQGRILLLRVDNSLRRQKLKSSSQVLYTCILLSVGVFLTFTLTFLPHLPVALYSAIKCFDFIHISDGKSQCVALMLIGETWAWRQRFTATNRNVTNTCTFNQ